MSATVLTIVATLMVAVLLPAFGIIQAKRSAKRIDHLRADDAHFAPSAAVSQPSGSGER